MDSFLVDYLKSGKAWVMVGSGPSIEMGYPSWEGLASFAVDTVRIERPGHKLHTLNAAMKHQDFPMIFEEAKAILGGPRLLQCLQERLKPSSQSRIYELIARWPVPVYMTTNYDDEIQRHLANLGEAYLTYSNSEDHMGHLSSEREGAIIKLHGDLRSETGLILTTGQYHDIETADSWQYWRTKMTSVFQMNRVVVIGHSLTDKNIRHVLEAAKQGAGVQQPICWIAPDVPPELGKEFLEKKRIRVVSYDNHDGEHRSLLRLIENISDFIPPRTAVHIQQQIAAMSQSPLGASAAAPGFYVFNKLAMQGDFDEKRVDIVVAAIQSTLPRLTSLGEFDLETALQVAGWPKDFPLELNFSNRVRERAVQQGLLVPAGDRFKISSQAEALALENKKSFEHMRERFENSLVLRIRRDYPSLSDSDASSMASDIEASLTGYFREGGLSLATTLFSGGQPSRQIVVPSSIIKFITEASARYDDILKRQAFCKVSVDAFVRAETVERDYLGRISQGFFAFHALGVFGDAAIERLRQARETVWLVDSSAQISALALAAPIHAVFKDCFSRLHAMGVRFFTTEKLFDETYKHLRFAAKVVKDNGPASPSVIAAVMGQAPYRQSNEFLQGFVRWQAAGNPCDWRSYLFQIFGSRDPVREVIKAALNKIGIEVISFHNWPGFSETDDALSEDYTAKIRRTWEGIRENKQVMPAVGGWDPLVDFDKKAKPESEALVIVKREREGDYWILSNRGQKSSSWFLSHTSILNIVEPEPGPRITWQPDAFLRFASTLAPVSDTQSADRAFETLLWGLAQSGLSLLDEQMVMSICGGVIDQATLDIDEMRQAYEDTLAHKYGESLESVMARISPINRPLAAIQLANEIAQTAAQRRQHAETMAAAATKRADQAEKELGKVAKYRKKVAQQELRKGKRKRK